MMLLNKQEQILNRFKTISPRMAPYMETILESELKKYISIVMDLTGAPLPEDAGKSVSWKFGLQEGRKCYTSIYEEKQFRERMGRIADAESDKYETYIQKYWDPFFKEIIGTPLPETEVVEAQKNAKKHYRRLEQYGITTESAEDLFTNPKSRIVTNATWQTIVRPVVTALLQYGWYAHKYPAPITKDEWCEAIDFTSAVLYPCSKEIYEKNDPALKKAAATAFQSMSFAMANIIHTLHILEENQAVQSFQDGVQKEVQLLQARKMIEQLNDKIGHLLQTNKALSEDAARATEQKHKEMMELTHEHQKELRTRDDYITYLEQKVSSLQRKAVNTDNPSANNETEKPWTNTELPESKVLFLGGHQNMTKKLLSMFPDWTFISDDHIAKDPPSDVKLVYFWIGHASHKLRQNIFKRLPADTQIVYLSATNIDMLVNEMKEKTWNMK